jgi:hypothetical protein
MRKGLCLIALVTSKSPTIPSECAGWNKAGLNSIAMPFRRHAQHYPRYGGVFFTDNNDFDQDSGNGALPEVYCTLAFSPQNMKLMGHPQDQGTLAGQIRAPNEKWLFHLKSQLTDSPGKGRNRAGHLPQKSANFCRHPDPILQGQ